MNTIPDVPRHFNLSIEQIKQNDDNVTVHFKDGRAETYDLIIGADGIYSATRRLTFHKDEYNLVNLGFYISTFTVPNYLNLRHTEIALEANQKLFTLNNDRDPKKARAAIMFRSQHILSDIRNEKEQKQFLYDTFHDFGWETKKILDLMPSSDDFYFDAITQVKMNSWTKGRVALVGDAGYSPSPLTGQGTIWH
jgi:2-polyprenyl-6-methoxyphenol hydroxylase-like FAD-dependent oxidoreductase